MIAFPEWILRRLGCRAATLWGILHSEQKGAAAQAPTPKQLSSMLKCSQQDVVSNISKLEEIGALTVDRSMRPPLYSTHYDNPVHSHQQKLQLDGPKKVRDSPAKEEVTFREMIGAFKDAWRECGLGDYTVCGKDRAVLASHRADFASYENALTEFRRRIKWAMKREFWEEHLGMRAVLETIPNQMALAEGTAKRARVSSGSGGLTPLSSITKEYLEVAKERGNMPAETARALGLDVPSTSESTESSGRGSPVST